MVGMFFGIVPMFVLKDFVQDCFVAQICAKMCVRAVICAYLRDEAIRNIEGLNRAQTREIEGCFYGPFHTLFSAVATDSTVCPN